MTDQLVGAAEIADLLNLSKQRVDQLTRTKGFPEPAAVISAGRVWRRDDIAAWMRTTGRAQQAPTGGHQP